MASTSLTLRSTEGPGVRFDGVPGAREALLVFAGEDVPADLRDAYADALRASGRSTALVDLAAWQPEVAGASGARREWELDDRRAMVDAARAHALLRAHLGEEPLLAVLGIGAQGTQAFLHACGTRDLFAACLISARLVYHELGARKNLSPIDLAMNLAVPLLGLFTRHDPRAPRADRDAFERELARAFRVHAFHETDDDAALPPPTPANVAVILDFLDEWAAEASGEDD